MPSEPSRRHRITASRQDTRAPCRLCGKEYALRDLLPGEMVRPAIVRIIEKEHPGWVPDGFICLADLRRLRAQYVKEALEAEGGEISAIEGEVLRSLRERDLLSANIFEEFDSKQTLGDRLADQLATFGGSWRFIISFGALLLCWIALNSVALLSRPFDPYPFILLNLVLSTLAALQAPVILMSQNRMEARDRLRSEHDYKVNLKAELEIRHLHEKMDHLLKHQWQRLVEIQQIQIELMEELAERKRS
ncbi:MAG: DUF1003 domain-containing protein [Chthoniobacteraceae bacterium]